MLASNLWSSCLSHPNAETTGVHHCAHLTFSTPYSCNGKGRWNSTSGKNTSACSWNSSIRKISVFYTVIYVFIQYGFVYSVLYFGVKSIYIQTFLGSWVGSHNCEGLVSTKSAVCFGWLITQERVSIVDLVWRQSLQVVFPLKLGGPTLNWLCESHSYCAVPSTLFKVYLKI